MDQFYGLARRVTLEESDKESRSMNRLVRESEMEAHARSTPDPDDD